MPTIPGNSKVKVVIGDASSTSGYPGLSPNDVMNAVSAYLNSLNGAYNVQSVSTSGGVLATITPVFAEEFQGTINMTNLYTTDTSQIIQDVALAFGTVTNGADTPTQITIPSYTPLPGSASGVGQSVDTGLAAATPTDAQIAADAAKNASLGISDSIAKALAQLGNLGTNLLIGLAAIVVLAIVLIAYGPNIGKIASHA